MAWLVHADATENDGINLSAKHLLFVGRRNLPP